MNVIKLLIVLGVMGGSYQYWKTHHSADSTDTAVEVASDNGFVILPPASGASAKTVLVIAAQNCPHEDAQRADSLADDLSRKGIPVDRTHNISFEYSGSDGSMAERIMSVMNGPLPIVIVGGRAKGNPSLEEVVAEYKSSRL